MEFQTEKEKQIHNLKQKIEDLKKLSDETGLKLDKEVETLQEKVKQMEDNYYQELGSWDKVKLARHPERPTTMEFINMLFDDFLELHGDRQFADDPAIIGGIASFEGTPVTVIGNQKGRNTKENIYRRFGMAKPEGYRKALRLMEQANKFGRPIITFINTAGAYPDKEAEERGQSEAIARNLREMAGFTVPVISIVIGEGGSGGALALGIANKVYMLENTYYSVISPEGAAAILWKDGSKAQQAAETLKITAQDLKELGVIDDIISEPKGGSHTDKEEQGKMVKKTIKKALKDLSLLTKEQLIEQRFEKFRAIGEYEEKNN